MTSETWRNKHIKNQKCVLLEFVNEDNRTRFIDWLADNGDIKIVEEVIHTKKIVIPDWPVDVDPCDITASKDLEKCNKLNNNKPLEETDKDGINGSNNSNIEEIMDEKDVKNKMLTNSIDEINKIIDSLKSEREYYLSMKLDSFKKLITIAQDGINTINGISKNSFDSLEKSNPKISENLQYSHRCQTQSETNRSLSLISTSNQKTSSDIDLDKSDIKQKEVSSPNKFKITDEYVEKNECRKDDPKNMTNDLISKTFEDDELGKCSISGEVPKCLQDAGYEAKPKLNPAKVDAIKTYVLEKFGSTQQNKEAVNEVFRNRCSNAARKMKTLKIEKDKEEK